MASRALLPRFPLPPQGSGLRGVRLPLLPTLVAVRFASSSKPIVLEKPAKFNPPSHGSRLKRNNPMPKHYGPALSGEEVAAQRTRSYPGMMAPQGTWAHWFWHSKLLHVFITMGTLMALGIFTFFMNYATNSPFKHLLPPLSDFWRHPLDFISTWRTVIIMHEKDKSLRAYEDRIQHQNDVMKRKYYMKMHGIETKDPVSVVFGKSVEEKTDAQIEAEALGLEPPPAEEQPPQRKKMFGIF